MNIKRVTLNGSVTPVTFDRKSSRWLVKNFSDEDLYVSFDVDATQDECAKIPSKCGQIVVENEYEGYSTVYFDTIYLNGTGEVEVQQIWYR